MPLPPNLITGKTARLPGDWQKQPSARGCNNLGVIAAMNRQVDHADLAAPGELRIVVYGPPPGKPRMTQCDKWKQRPCVMGYRFWCDRVRKAVGNKLPAAESIMALDWTAYFEPPQSWSKKRRAACIGQLHRNKPDRDNIEKAVLDCLYRQDSRIAMGAIQKRWDWTARLEITIRYRPEGG